MSSDSDYEVSIVRVGRHNCSSLFEVFWNIADIAVVNSVANRHNNHSVKELNEVRRRRVDCAQNSHSLFGFLLEQLTNGIRGTGVQAGGWLIKE